VEQHGVAVRRGTLDIEAADGRVAAGAVLDDELHVALDLDLGRDQAREGVDAAARRNRNDDADRAIGERRLRAQHIRCGYGASRRQHCSDCVTAIDAARHGRFSEWMACVLVPLRQASAEL
jgi:hypothetical protein